MKHKINLVLTDVDGTLVPIYGTKPSQKVIESVQAIQSSGVDIAPVTGRPYEMAKDLFQHIGFHELGVFDSGASVRRVDTGEIVWKNWLSVDRLKEVVGMLLPVSEIIDFYPIFKEVKATEVTLDDVVEEAPYVFAYVYDNEAGRQVVKSLQADRTLNVNVHYAHSSWVGFINIQVLDCQADKYHGVLALRKLVHSSPETTLAIGDSANDLPLFNVAGIKIAMGNAIEELKAVADYVVSDVDNDGFAEAMERFVLGES
jgi:HAD superfamily hydrolase (TIGR01484 family)